MRRSDLLRWGITLAMMLGLLAVGRIEFRHIQGWMLQREATREFYDGDMALSIDLVEKGCRLFPDNPEWLFDAAETISDYIHDRDWQPVQTDELADLTRRSIRYYLDAIDASPPNAWAYANLGILVGRISEIRGEWKAIDLADLALDPVGRLTDLEHLQEAFLVKSASIEPQDYYTLDFLAHFYWTNGFIQRAEDHVQAAVKLQPIIERHFYVRAMIEDPVILAAAERGLQDALAWEKTEDPPERIHRRMAIIYLEMDLNEKARRSFEAVAEDSPYPQYLKYQIGNIYLDEGNLEAALKSFQRAVELDPAYYRGWLLSGVTLSRLGQHEDALLALRRARGLEPLEYQPIWILAMELYRTGELDESIRLLKQLTRDFSKKREPYNQLIVIYSQQGQSHRAIEVARQLVWTFPDEPVYQKQLEQLEETARLGR